MKKCQICKEEKEDVEFRRNPYAFEIYNEEIWEWTCRECYEHEIDDI